MPPATLTEELDAAFQMARELHAAQTRKRTDILARSRASCRKAATAAFTIARTSRPTGATTASPERGRTWPTRTLPRHVGSPPAALRRGTLEIDRYPAFGATITQWLIARDMPT